MNAALPTPRIYPGRPCHIVNLQNCKIVHFVLFFSCWVQVPIGYSGSRKLTHQEKHSSLGPAQSWGWWMRADSIAGQMLTIRSTFAIRAPLGSARLF